MVMFMIALVAYLPLILHILVVASLVDAYLVRRLRIIYLLLVYILYSVAMAYSMSILPSIFWILVANPFIPLIPLLVPLHVYFDMKWNPWKYKRSLGELSESLFGLARFYYYVRRDFWSTTLFLATPVAAAVFSASSIIDMGLIKDQCISGKITMCPEWVSLITPEMIGSMVIMIAIIDFAAGIIAIKIMDRIYGEG